MDSYPPEVIYPNAVISPEEFELLVLKMFKQLSPELEITHRETIKGFNGEYNIDLAVRFQVLGANFLVLVECKNHKSPLKRDYVQVLRDRVDSVGAQKGIIVSASSFQLGAINYAKTHNIALIRLINDEFRYERRSREFINMKHDISNLSGKVSMQWIESTSETSLTSKVIDNIEEVLGISEK